MTTRNCSSASDSQARVHSSRDQRMATGPVVSTPTGRQMPPGEAAGANGPFWSEPVIERLAPERSPSQDTSTASTWSPGGPSNSVMSKRWAAK
jgi:hypothetical protein